MRSVDDALAARVPCLPASFDEFVRRVSSAFNALVVCLAASRVTVSIWRSAEAKPLEYPLPALVPAVPASTPPPLNALPNALSAPLPAVSPKVTPSF